jgi:surface protein
VLFNNTGDKAKLLGAQIGDTGFTSCANAFHGCANFNLLVGYANTQNVVSMANMFLNASTFNQSVANFNTAKVTTMLCMFQGASAFNQSVANFNTAKVTNMDSMFYETTAFKQSLATFNMAAVTVLDDMLNGCNINATGTTTNYDATLVAWAAQDLVNSLAMHAGTSKYSDTGQAARTAIAADDSWTFTDGGHI